MLDGGRGLPILRNLLITKLSPCIWPRYRTLHPLPSKPTLDFVGLGMCVTKCFHSNITSCTNLNLWQCWICFLECRCDTLGCIKIAVRWSYRRNPHPLSCRAYTKPLPSGAIREVHVCLRDGMASALHTDKVHTSDFHTASIKVAIL